MSRERNGFMTLKEKELKEKRRKLREQLVQLRYCDHEVTCGCGKTVPVTAAYKCFYCGLWFCPTCAKDHFAEHDLEDLLYALDSGLPLEGLTAETFERVIAKFNRPALQRSYRERHDIKD